MGVIPLIVGLGLATSAIRLVPELKAKGEYKKVSDIIKLTIGLPLPETLLITLIGVLLSKFLSKIFLKSPDYFSYIICILFISFLYSIFDRITLVYQSLQDFKKIAFLSIFTNLLSRILAVIFFLKKYELIGIFKGFIIGTCLGVIIGLFTLREYIFSKYHGYPIKEYIKFSFPYYLQGWNQFIFTQLDQLFVSLFTTPEKLAVFFIGKKIVQPFILVSLSLKEAVNVKLSEKKGKGIEHFKRDLSKFGSFFIWFGLFLSLSIVYNSKLLITLVGGELYKDYYYIVDLLSLYLFFYLVYSVFNTGIYLIEEPKVYLNLYFYFSMINMLIVLILGNLFGLVGFSISQSVGTIFAIIYMIKKFNNKWIYVNFNEVRLILLVMIIFYLLGIVTNAFLSSYVCFLLFIFVAYFLKYFFIKEKVLFSNFL